ncbi:MAG: hypothetical protein WCJ58_04135 [bacterium]
MTPEAGSLIFDWAVGLAGAYVSSGGKNMFWKIPLIITPLAVGLAHNGPEGFVAALVGEFIFGPLAYCLGKSISTGRLKM